MLCAAVADGNLENVKVQLNFSSYLLKDAALHNLKRKGTQCIKCDAWECWQRVNMW